MTNQKTYLINLWKEARTRFENQLKTLQSEDLQKRLGDSPNSVGFLIRHIADVELLFAKNVFGADDVKVSAKTVIEKRDTGQWTDLDELLEYAQYARKSLLEILEQQAEADWEATITTNEFGTKTKVEAMGRIVSHTAYHAGQMAIVNKYGK
ncbi:MAG: DinB family protein [Cryomorphaceae bacterium]|nr:MAG: DinB family protein [Cryomorphaceae bacterium]